MSIEDIRVLTAQLAADPSSLVFLPLAEALRRRGQLDAAEKVALAGLTRYPELADAHDLLARILGDRGDLERAFDEWDIALRHDARHAGAHKGIGFLYYVAGDLPKALQHLESALQADPEAEGVAAAAARVREALAEPLASEAAAPVVPTEPEPEAAPEPVPPAMPIRIVVVNGLKRYTCHRGPLCSARRWRATDTVAAASAGPTSGGRAMGGGSWPASTDSRAPSTGCPCAPPPDRRVPGRSRSGRGPGSPARGTPRWRCHRGTRFPPAA